MTDIFSREKRSKIMSRIRSKWTKQEVLVHKMLLANKIKHKMHPKIDGAPDIALRKRKIVIFLDGCFWHKCPRHYKEPKIRLEFWSTKIQKNVLRDKKNTNLLRKKGYTVIRVWEHEIGKRGQLPAKDLIMIKH